jgi:hypothetical protein
LEVQRPLVNCEGGEEGWRRIGIEPLWLIQSAESMRRRGMKHEVQLGMSCNHACIDESIDLWALMSIYTTEEPSSCDCIEFGTQGEGYIGSVRNRGLADVLKNCLALFSLTTTSWEFVWILFAVSYLFRNMETGGWWTDVFGTYHTYLVRMK